MFRALTGVYEPSAIQQLPDGRFLVAEDEKETPFALVTLHADGSVSSVPLQPAGGDEEGGAGKLADLEALTGDAAGNVYAITSHSRNSQGEEKKSREKILRFRIEGDRMVAPAVVKNLKAALAAAHPVLARAVAIPDVKNYGGLNIEALEMSPDGRLLVGFRSPLLSGRAVVASIDNPATAFDGAEPRIAPELVTLDCGGHGLRALSWVAALNGYLLVSGPVGREQVHFKLWFWNGQAGQAPCPASVDSLPGFAHAEGICPASVGGVPKIMVVSDDGSREEGRPAGYLLLDLAQMRIG